MLNHQYTVEIFKDNFIPSKPWGANLIDDTEEVIYLNWTYAFKTKKAVIQEARAVLGEDVKITYNGVEQ